MKSHESQSRTIEAQFLKQRARNWKCLVLCVTRTVNLKTDFKTLYTVYWNKNILHLFLSTTQTKRNKRRWTTATAITRTGYYSKKSSNRSIVLCVLRDACHELFCVFGDFYASVTRDAEVTKSLQLRRFWAFFKIVWFRWLGDFLVLLKGAMTKWRNTEDWKDTEQWPQHKTMPIKPTIVSISPQNTECLVETTCDIYI